MPKYYSQELQPQNETPECCGYFMKLVSQTNLEHAV